MKIRQYVKPSAGLLIAVTIISCSSHPLPATMTANFGTRISDAGLKHFQVTIPLIIDSKEIRAQRIEDSTHSKRAQMQKQAKRISQLLEAETERQLTDTGFCRDGFWVIDSNAYAKPPYVRGECNEPATPDDRDNFPNTFAQW